MNRAEVHVMSVVVFRYRLRAGAEANFERRRTELVRLVAQMPGFVATKDFVAADGERAALVEFRSAEELDAARNHPDLRAALEQNLERSFAQYALQVCELVREARFTAEPSADIATGVAATGDPRARFEPYAGGCFCRKVRYRIEGKPRVPSICHCSMCRRVSGAPMVAWATFRAERMDWLEGTPKRFSSSDKAERSFCPDCGTALTFRFAAHPDWVDVTLASLDDPGRVIPEDHTFTRSQIGWVRVADGLPRFEAERPE